MNTINQKTSERMKRKVETLIAKHQKRVQNLENTLSKELKKVVKDELTKTKNKRAL